MPALVGLPRLGARGGPDHPQRLTPSAAGCARSRCWRWAGRRGPRRSSLRPPGRQTSTSSGSAGAARKRASVARSPPSPRFAADVSAASGAAAVSASDSGAALLGSSSTASAATTGCSSATSPVPLDRRLRQQGSVRGVCSRRHARHWRRRVDGVLGSGVLDGASDDRGFRRVQALRSPSQPHPLRALKPHPPSPAKARRRPVLRRMAASGLASARARFRLGNGRRLRRLRPLLHAIAERAQDRREILSRRSRQRGHRLGHGEADAFERARRASRRPNWAARRAPAG